jgi:hypothetical protein
MIPKTSLSRRHMLALTASAIGGGLLTAAIPRCARAEDLPHLAESDSTAVALGYREDATKVDPTKYATHKAGQTCANCRFFGGTGAWGGCQLFPGKAVTAKGWCSAYNAKA